MHMKLEDMGYGVYSKGNTTIVYSYDKSDILEKIPLDGEIGEPSDLSGRAYIYKLEDDMVVRHVIHGGAFRHITRDRFLGLGRSLRELKVSHYLIEKNVLTPEIIAIRYIRDGIFYSIWVISRLVPNSSDLLEYVKTYQYKVPAIMEKAGILVRRIHELGVFHPDLQIKNILVDSDSRLWMLDLDKARYMGYVPSLARRMNINRFFRSCKKRSARGEILLPKGWEQAFLKGYSGAYSS